MEGDRTTRALARIEAASARIEAALARRSQSGPDSAPDSRTPSDPSLQARYDRLREQAEGALEEVDALIESLSS